MEFKESVKAMKEGKKVRRTKWDKCEYMELDYPFKVLCADANIRKALRVQIPRTN